MPNRMIRGMPQIGNTSRETATRHLEDSLIAPLAEAASSSSNVATTEIARGLSGLPGLPGFYNVGVSGIRSEDDAMFVLASGRNFTGNSYIPYQLNPGEQVADALK